MPICCICGDRQDHTFKYNPIVHLQLMLLRFADRKTVCMDCDNNIHRGELMVMRTQLPLPRKKGAVPLGVYATRDYLSLEPLCEYTGKIINVLEKTKSESLYIVKLFEEGTKLDDQKFLDGDCREAMYINHHVPGLFDENCKMFLVGKRNPKLIIETLRSITAGEELFMSYGDEYFGEEHARIEELSAAEVHKYYSAQYDSIPGKLGTNLRYNSNLVPGVAQWVTKASKIVKDREVAKKEKKKGAS